MSNGYNPYCNDNFPESESCADQKREIDAPKKDPCFDEPAKFDRDLPFCVTTAISQPRDLIQPLVGNVFTFEVENDANVPFTFEWWIGCPGAPIRQLDPSDVEFIINEEKKTTISFRASHLEETGVAVVVDDTPGEVVKTTVGLFAIAKSRCGDFNSICIDQLDELPHEIQEVVAQISPFPVRLGVRELVAQLGVGVLTQHFLRGLAAQFSFTPADNHLVSELVAQFGGVWTHPDDDTIFA